MDVLCGLGSLLCSTTFRLLVALFLLVWLLLVSPWKRYHGPPGPRPLRGLGNLFQLDLKNLHLCLWKLSRQYGSVLSVFMGPERVVVLCGYQTVKEALVSRAEEFGERASTHISDEMFNGHGLAWANGHTWKEMRRFALATLRDFGMGRKVCENKISEECGHLVRVLKDLKGRPFSTMKPLNYAVSNIIFSMVYGTRFQYQDPQFTALVDRINTRIRLGGSPTVMLYNMFPWTKRWIKDRQKLIDILEFFKQENRGLIRDLKETINQAEPRGFIDAFLVRQMELQAAGVEDHEFHEENLTASVLSLFSAGTDTTSNTLTWGLLILTKYPHYQDLVREEISTVIGRRQVQIEDRKDLPFTDAVIHEIQRFANIAPMALAHRTSCDLIFQGHTIKNGTTIVPLLTSVHFDESEWEEPHSFRPQHFLSDDGKFRKRDAFMPFSAGRRACLGESLARMELFLFFVTLLQWFRFSPPPGVCEEELDLTPEVGMGLTTRPHLLCAQPIP
ncbi:unnamed protein product [Knipowitschia caucasica]